MLEVDLHLEDTITICVRVTPDESEDGENESDSQAAG